MKPVNLSRRLLRSIGIALILFYFGFHMLSGDQGLIGRMVELHKQEQLRAEIKEIKLKKERLERNLALIRGPDIDPDLLSELAKDQLSYAGQNEVMMVK